MICPLLSERRKIIAETAKCMLRDRIIHCHEKYIPLLYCPLPVRESVEDMHSAYKALGGNGAIDHIVTEMNELPTIKKEEK